MAIRITAIRKDNGNHENPHLGITFFRWVNEQTQASGDTSREAMYDWIVNKKGTAYVQDQTGNRAYVYGAISPFGNPYVRTAANKTWTDNLLQLPEF